MGRSTMSAIKIVIFAKSKEHRDYLKGKITTSKCSILLFENEAICFDNLASIRPDAVIVCTNTKAVVWRFIFAVRTLSLSLRLIVLTDTLHIETFQFGNDGAQGPLFVGLKHVDDLFQAIDNGLKFIPQAEMLNIDLSLLGESDSMRHIRSVLPKLKEAEEPILISGEPGAGKETLARLLGFSNNGNSIFVKIDCQGLIQKELHIPSHFQEGSFKDKHTDITIFIDRIEKAEQQNSIKIIDVDGKQQKTGCG